MTTRFRGITIREGMLFDGPAGWGEFCPFREYDAREAASWMATVIEAATVGWPEPGQELGAALKHSEGVAPLT